MEKLSRTADRYLDLFQKEHRLIKEEERLRVKLKQEEDQERRNFSLFQLALRRSQEKEKIRAEKTKYWSLIGSIVGAFFGIFGSFCFSRIFVLAFSSSE